MKPYYDDGKGIVIYNCDCRELVSSLGEFDMVLADPPYGNGFAAQPTTGGRRRGQLKEQWDNAPVDGLEFILAMGDIQVVWGGNNYSLSPSRGWLCWFKPDAPPSMSQIELAWTNQDMLSKTISCSIAQTNPERLGHPTQKPLRVISWNIAMFPNVRTILDPFMGTGTTLRVAKDLGLRAVGIEINEMYAELSAKRLSQEVFAFT